MEKIGKSPKVLGLDISTKTIGWALFDIQKKNLLELTHFSPKTKEKLENTKTGLFNLINESTHFITCIGMDGYARHKISKKLESYGLKPISLISKFAILDDLDHMGEGLSVMPGAVVHKFSKIGDQCIFNTNSTVEDERLKELSKFDNQYR